MDILFPQIFWKIIFHGININDYIHKYHPPLYPIRD